MSSKNEDIILKTVSIDDIIPYENNPRINDGAVSAVAESIRQTGYNSLIVVDENMVVLAGHTRLKALKQLGWDTVQVAIAAGRSEEEKEKFRILDNKTGEIAEWDDGLLKQLLENLDFEGFDFGFDDLVAEEQTEVVEDDYDPVLPEEPVSKLGDVWQLGKHRLMVGDSTKLEDVKKLMGDEMADMLLTDPPYGVSYEGSNGLTIQNDSLDGEEFVVFLQNAFASANAVMKPGAVFYIWYASAKVWHFLEACNRVPWQVRQELIWKKSALIMGRQDYQWIHEPCQPAGTMVRTPEGLVPIEQLKDGDKVVSFDTISSCVKGYKEGYEVKTASRQYDGIMYGIRVNGAITRATDNHQFSVRFNPETSGKWCTYLMKRGRWWRVGITRTYDARGFGLKHRYEQENADEAWLIDTFETRADAQMGEQLLAAKYGIPYTHWNVERGISDDYNHRTEKQIDWLYDNIDLDELNKNAISLLHDFGRSERFPLVSEKTKGEKFSRRVTARIEACNIIPDLMQVPAAYDKYDGTHTFEWKTIVAVTREEFSGIVYSLAVKTFEHYIADGIVTHNCLYGWTDGASHLWASDRKQTTVMEFEKPKKNDIHPTMKPVALFDYQMKNNTKPGDVVLDLFAGSGTTIIAAQQNGRLARCMEYDPRYADAIINRWEEFTGEKAVLLS